MSRSFDLKQGFWLCKNVLLVQSEAKEREFLIAVFFKRPKFVSLARWILKLYKTA